MRVSGDGFADGTSYSTSYVVGTPGRNVAVAAASTPGSARSASSVVATRCCQGFVGVDSAKPLFTWNVRIVARSKPASTRESSWKLRTSKPAPTSNATDSVTCTPASDQCSECRPETRAPEPPLATFATSPDRACLSAGNRPQSNVTIAT